MENDKAAVEQIEAIIGCLQHQVLNNLDALAGKATGLDLTALDLLVKKPIMQSVTKLRSMRFSILNPGLSKPANGGNKQ